MFRIIALLEYNAFLSGSPQFNVFESAETLFAEDFDVIRSTHNPLNAVNPSHALSCDTPPYHQTSRPMLNGFFSETSIQNLPRLYPTILAAIRLESHEFGLVQKYHSLPVLDSPPFVL